jgi:hypothetical protein
MRLSITIDIPDEQLRELFRRAQAHPPGGNGRSLPPEEPPDEPPDVQREPAAPVVDGHSYYEWIMGQPHAKELRAAVQSVGKKLGYGWQIAGWSPAQVAEVREQLAARPPRWGGSAAAAR